MRRVGLFLAFIFWLTWMACFLSAACNDGDDDDDNDDNDDDSENPTIGACICCYTVDAEIWGYCWNVGFADECDTGCGLMYKEHLVDVLFFDESACQDHHSHQECRAR